MVLPTSAVLSNNSTDDPASVLPVKAGWLMFVIPSLLKAPLSLAGLSITAIEGGVVSIVTDKADELAPAFPAASVACATMKCACRRTVCWK